MKMKQSLPMDAKDSPQLSCPPRDLVPTGAKDSHTDLHSYRSGIRGCTRYPQGPPAHKYPLPLWLSAGHRE
jgi:hypothetical protein